MLISKFRDLILMEISEEKLLSIACDSFTNEVNKNNDISEVDSHIIGYLTTRVCLFKTLCFRAIPNIIINNLYTKKDGRGKKIKGGIQKAIEEFNNTYINERLNDDNLTGTMNESIKDGVDTACAITIIGEEGEHERLWDILDKDIVVVIGKPLENKEDINIISNDSNNLLSMESLKVILDYSKDVITIGSKGIDNEIKSLEEINGIKILKKDNLSMNLYDYVIPSSSVIAIMEEEMFSTIRRKIKEDMKIIGEVKINN